MHIPLWIGQRHSASQNPVTAWMILGNLLQSLVKVDDVILQW
jgi:hypothetical protein